MTRRDKYETHTLTGAKAMQFLLDKGYVLFSPQLQAFVSTAMLDNFGGGSGELSSGVENNAGCIGSPPDFSKVPPGPRSTGKHPCGPKFTDREKNDLKNDILTRYKTWFHHWCNNGGSGCAVWVKGVKDQLIAWAKNANYLSIQRQANYKVIFNRMNCFDGCVMTRNASGWGKAERNQCIKECKQQHPFCVK